VNAGVKKGERLTINANSFTERDYLVRRHHDRHHSGLAVCPPYLYWARYEFRVRHSFNCCGASGASEQHHQQNLKEYIEGSTNSRVHHFY